MYPRKKWNEVLTIVSGKNQKAVENPDGKYPIYGSGGIIGHADDYLCGADTVIVGRKGTIDDPLYVSEPFWNIDTAFGVVAGEELLPKYLFYFCRLFNFKSLDKSTGRPSIAKTDLLKIEMPVPDKNIQERIVAQIEELFSELDNAESTLQATKQQLAVYRQAVLKEAFEGKYTSTWRKEHPNSKIENLLDELKNQRKTAGNNKSYVPIEAIELTELPHSWRWISIGDITNGVEYGTSRKSLKEGRIPVLRMGNMKKGLIDWEDLVYSDDEDEINRYLLKPNDVLFNRTNSSEHVGKTSIYKGERPAIFAGYLIRINQFQEINANYLTYFMNSFVAKNYAGKVKTDGVNQSNISGTKLCTFPFPVCPIDEQNQVVEEIESRLSECDAIEQTVEKTLLQLQSMRQSVLKEAFEGRL